MYSQDITENNTTNQNDCERWVVHFLQILITK